MPNTRDWKNRFHIMDSNGISRGKLGIFLNTLTNRMEFNVFVTRAKFGFLPVCLPGAIFRWSSKQCLFDFFRCFRSASAASRTSTFVRQKLQIDFSNIDYKSLTSCIRDIKLVSCLNGCSKTPINR